MIPASVWFKTPCLPEVKLEGLVQNRTLSEVSETDKKKLTKLNLQALVNKLKINNKLSNLEWLVLLNKDKEISELNLGKQTEIGDLVWKNLFKKAELFQNTMQKLMFDFECDYQKFPVCFKETLLKQPRRPVGDISILQLDWVKGMILADRKICLNASLKHGLTPKKFCQKIKFKSDADYLNDMTRLSSEIISPAPTIKEQQWWICCHDEVNSTDTLVMVELLLDKLTVLGSDSPLDKWLTKYYLPKSPHTHFLKLNEKARQQLLSLYNVTTYDEVKKIFELLRDTSIDSSLQEWEVRNLKSRIDFWSDYSKSFKRVRFILTRRAYELLKNKIHIDRSRIAIMADDFRNNSSEICIFEFENYFVVERFRNEFDMGFFVKKAILEKQLFEAENFDAWSIRLLIPDGIHDHKNDYQYFASLALRDRYGIKANRDSKIATWRRPDRDREEKRKQMLQSRYAIGQNYFNT